MFLHSMMVLLSLHRALRLGHYMVSLYSTLLSDVKQNSNMGSKWTSHCRHHHHLLHHHVTTSLQHHHGCRHTHSPYNLQSTANSPCVNRDYTSSYPNPPEDRTVVLLSPSGQMRDRDWLIHKEVRRRVMESTCGNCTKDGSLPERKRKQLQKHISFNVTGKK